MTIQNLVQKLTRIYQSNCKVDPQTVDAYNCQLWKLDPQDSYKTLLNQFENNKEGVTLKRTKLDLNTVLEV